MSNRPRSSYPSEAQEQQVIADWCKWQPYLDPGDVFSVPNQALYGAGSTKNKILSHAGVSDLCIPDPNKHHPGGWLELKRQREYYQKTKKKTKKKTNKPWPGASDAQLDFLHRRGTLGSAVIIAYGADEAIRFIELYFSDHHFPYNGEFQR